MLIDCDRCEMRNIACSDCVVNVLLGNDENEFDGAERRAIGVLADAGMVPPLRLSVVESRPAESRETDGTEPMERSA
ncbi:hypothetical protein [Phytoactinopolyspora endophytica]|uniref:hypothetical protein n=1 Tax=Phytoactinopolyspora endophytica TaxID=1642495 RepID=UPI00101C746D|nr:hypothetical protein [Phytoactinopolyspora endophytica]